MAAADVDAAPVASTAGRVSKVTAYRSMTSSWLPTASMRQLGENFTSEMSFWQSRRVTNSDNA